MSKPADYDWSLMDLDGQPVSFAKFKGKTVFLNIWATWCGPCVGEMPSIAKLARNPRLQDKNIEFVCVSTDDVGRCRPPVPGRQELDHDDSSRRQGALGVLDRGHPGDISDRPRRPDRGQQSWRG